MGGARDMTGDVVEKPTPATLRSVLRDLYFGSDRRAIRFQLAILAFDMVTVTFFVVTTFMPVEGWILVADLVIAVCLILEFAARLCISPRPLQTCDSRLPLWISSSSPRSSCQRSASILAFCASCAPCA